jgi:hypothetical protein
MIAFKLSPAAADAMLKKWNAAHPERQITAEFMIPVVTDPLVLERLAQLSFPGEDLNDTIVRIFGSLQ